MVGTGPPLHMLINNPHVVHFGILMVLYKYCKTQATITHFPVCVVDFISTFREH